MKFVKYTSKELSKIKEMLNGVMSFASQALLQKEGEVIGSEIVDGLEVREGYFLEVSKKIADRGWAEEAELLPHKAILRNTIESEGVTGSTEPVCIILRGILRKVYEKYYGGLIIINETECRGVSGGEKCVFEIKFI